MNAMLGPTPKPDHDEHFGARNPLPPPFSGSRAEWIAPDRTVVEVEDESERRGTRSTHGSEGHVSAAWRRASPLAPLCSSVDLGEQALCDARIREVDLVAKCHRRIVLHRAATARFR